MKTGTELIAAERQRQIEKEGWTPEHDDEHSLGEMVSAAICYASETLDVEILKACGHSYKDPWPWSIGWDKRRQHRVGYGFSDGNEGIQEAMRYHIFDGKIKCLEIAGALLAAEIDRVQRAKAKHMARVKRLKEPQ